jgi:hypothetical protein
MADVAFSSHKLLDLRLINVEAEHFESQARKELGEGQADVTKPHYTRREASCFYVLKKTVQMKGGYSRTHV